ncbi:MULTISPECIES: hypothetical protein [unclassified Streptomyces]|uniref:hypothetical protein n=1 Tax=unclassified Streptomyces TaxID=2593676 RepID=UPI00131E0C01|nr:MULTISPECIES: hypothetical protein [unclassified Streptomyces]
MPTDTDPDSAEDAASSRTAARMLVAELRNCGTAELRNPEVAPADLVHSGTVSGRGRDLHLDLPGLGPRRDLPASGA